MGKYDWLVSGFNNLEFTAFDTETTGLDPKQNRIVEAGGIKFDRLGPKSRFNSLINPCITMPPEVSKINGITDSMLQNEPIAAFVIPNFIKFIAQTILVAHNAPFDVSFINSELSRLSRPPLQNQVLDTRILCKDIFPGLPKYSLQELAKYFGITAKNAHRAEDDARVCMELFLVCCKRLKELNPNISVEPFVMNSSPNTNTSHELKPTIEARSLDQDLFDDTYDDVDIEDITEV